LGKAAKDDPTAFVIVSPAHEVLGRGFNPLAGVGNRNGERLDTFYSKCSNFTALISNIENRVPIDI
jgi:hypothetical protein